MQISAIGNDGALVFALHAVKQKDYHCLECHEPVRVRLSVRRKAHFFHTHPNRRCSLHAKGMPHLICQVNLKNALPEGESEIECRFPLISRIADVAWHARKIVYEIQYSPISAEEVLGRTSAYQSIGYQVVWILSDRRFNQFALSAAEDALLKLPHYYTNMDENGIGFIYDQFSCIQKGLRIYRLQQLPIDPTCPYAIGKDMMEGFSQIHGKIIERASFWKMGFVGDLFDRLMKTLPECESSPDWLLIKRMQEMPEESFNLAFVKSCFSRWVKAPYQAVFQRILERSCR